MKKGKALTAAVLALCCLAALFPPAALADKTKEYEELFWEEIQRAPKNMQVGKDMDAEYGEALVNRLIELGYLNRDEKATASKGKMSVRPSQVSAANFFASVMNVEDGASAKEITPLVYALLHSNLARKCPTPIFTSKNCETVWNYNPNGNETAYVSMQVERIVHNGSYISLVGTTLEKGWTCTVIYSYVDQSIDFLPGDKVFAFGRVEDYTPSQKAATIAAELTAFAE